MRFSIRSSFPAAHRIRIDARGTREPAHAHTWRVEACLKLRRGSGDPAGGAHDGESAAVAARHFLDRWVARYEGRSFNDVAPFDHINPTAEEVARAFADEIAAALPQILVVRVEIGEAAGFSATYWPAPPLLSAGSTR